MAGINQLMQNSRLKRIFGNQSTPTFGGNYQGPTPSVPNPKEVDKTLILENPPSTETQYDTTASDRFNKFLESYPQENNPGLLRKISAGVLGSLAGMGGGDIGSTMEGVLHPGYKGAVETWKNQVSPMERAASEERMTNANLRTSAASIRSNEARNRQLDEAEKHNRATEETSRAKNELLAFKIRNPGFIFNFNGPTVMVGDPATGEFRDTGHATGSLSDADKAELSHTNKLTEISASGEQSRKTAEVTGEQARETEGVRQTGRIASIEATGKQARDTKGTTPAATTRPVETPGNTRIRWANNAQDLIRTNPELGKFIKMDPNVTNGFSIGPSGNYWKKVTPTQFQIDAINNYIKNTGASQTNTPTPTDKRIAVIGPNGESGTMLESELAQYPGWKRKVGM